jgi:transcriptional regulator with XRE-family HTH domain
MALNFATLLRNHRLAARVSQEEHAEAAHISAAAVGAYERGVRLSPHRVTIGRLADALGLTGSDRAHFMASAQRRLGNQHPPEEAAVIELWRTLLDTQSDDQLKAPANSAIELLRAINDTVELATCWTLPAERLERAGQRERARSARNCARALSCEKRHRKHEVGIGVSPAIASKSRGDTCGRTPPG